MIGKIFGSIFTLIIFLSINVSWAQQKPKNYDYKAYWKPRAEKHFRENQHAWRGEILKNYSGNMALNEIEIRVVNVGNSPKSLFKSNTIIFPPNYLFRVITKTADIALIGDVFTHMLQQGDTATMMCFFELISYYDHLVDNYDFRVCETPQLRILAKIREEKINLDWPEFYSDIIFFYDRAIKFALAHELGHFALNHSMNLTPKENRSQEYSADQWAVSMISEGDSIDDFLNSVLIFIALSGLPQNSFLESDTELSDSASHDSQFCRFKALFLARGNPAIFDWALSELGVDEMLNLALSSFGSDRDSFVNQFFNGIKGIDCLQ